MIKPLTVDETIIRLKELKENGYGDYIMCSLDKVLDYNNLEFRSPDYNVLHIIQGIEVD